MSSARPWLHLALRRMAEERALVGAAFVVALVAATVAAACVVYPDTATRRGLLAVLAAGEPAATTILVTADVAPADVAVVDAEVAATTQAALGAGAGTLIRTARSESWQLPGGEGRAHPPLTVFAWDEGLAERTTLVAGSRSGPGSAGQLDAVVTTGAAAGLDVRPGSILEVGSRLDPARRLTVRIAGIVEVDDPGDPAWGNDPLVLGGTIQPGSFPLRGPLFVEREALLRETAVAQVTLAWRALPAFERLGPEDVGPVHDAVAGLAARLESLLGPQDPVTVTTGLPSVLDAAGGGILAGRSGTALIALQLLVLAAYALVLLAALVVDQRRAATQLAAARGAPPLAMVGLAALEGVLIALPAVVLGSLLAVPLAGILAGADGGGGAEPRLTGAAVALALAAGAVTVVGMVLPTLASLGPVARLRGSLAVRGSRGLAERTGIDVALLVLMGLAFWQLRENGSPIARAGSGAAVDPLLAAAPAIGLLAGGLVALRIGPLIGSWLERPAGGATGTVGSLAARGVARRSGEAGRAALLIVVSTGIILFAAAYGQTWERSQRDQVAAAIPADLVGRAPTGRDASPAWLARAGLLELPGVGEAVPAVREAFAVGNVLPAGVLVAVPAGPAATMLQVRADLADAPPAELLAALAAGRPAPSVLALPDDALALRLGVDAALVATAGEDGTRRPIPAGWTGLGTAVVVQDGLGLLHRFQGAVGRVTGGPQELEVPLTARAGGGSRLVRLVAPLAVVAIELGLTLPDQVAAAGALRLTGIRAVTGAPGGSTSEAAVDLGSATTGWGAVRGAFGTPPAALPGGLEGPLAAALDEPVVGPVPVVVGFGAANAPALTDAAIPALVDGDVRDALGLAVGDLVPLQRGFGAVQRIRVVGVVEVLPGIAPGTGGVLVDLPTLALADRARDGTVASPTEWWLGAAPGADDLADAAPGAGELGLTDVRVRAAAARERLDDPLALGTRGALGLAAGAALVFGMIGFAAAGWRSVRTRRTELAVARALGLERGQTATWLALELAFQLAVGIVGGILLGLLLAWAVLPSVTLTPDGASPVPEPVVVVPWGLVGLLVAAGVAAFLAALPALRRLGRGETLAGELREAAP